jgi:hypothetical protein
MWLRFPPHSGVLACPVSLPAHVVTLLERGHPPLGGAILKYCVPPSGIGAERGEAFLQVSFSPPSPAHGIAGLPDQRQPPYSLPPALLDTFRASSSLASTPALDPETSLDCNGRK